MNSNLAALESPAVAHPLSREPWLPRIGPQPGRQVLVLGLGNDLLCDDAIGLNIIRHLAPQFDGSPDIDLLETCEMGLSLLDFIIDYPGLILVDAVQTRLAPPGFLHEIELGDLKILPSMAPHFLGIGEILALGRALGLQVPAEVRIFAVEAGDPFTVSTTMTPALTAALPGLAARVAQAAQALAGRS